MSTNALSTMPKDGSKPPRASRYRRRNTAAGAVIVALTTAVSLVASPAVGAPVHDTTHRAGPSVTMPEGKIYGGVDGDWQEAQRRTGLTMGRHTYASLEGSVPEGRMITVNANATWRQVANASPGSSIYNNMVRWADTIKNRGGTVLVAYSHEPEISSKRWMGSSSDFKAAYAKFVTVFRSRGATNVKQVVQLTAWSYRSGSGDPSNVAKWYPGDSYVDVLGADAYNWASCGEGKGKWNELSTLADPVLKFAKSRNKMIAFPEYGATADSKRATWLSNAKSYLVANEAWIAGAYYFNRPPTNPSNKDCAWKLTTDAEYAALGSMLRDQNFTR